MKVIVTGASKGIGRSIADIFAAHGHDLILCSRNEVLLYKTMEELQTRYPGVEIKSEKKNLN